MGCTSSLEKREHRQPSHYRVVTLFYETLPTTCESSPIRVDQCSKGQQVIQKVALLPVAALPPISCWPPVASNVSLYVVDNSASKQLGPTDRVQYAEC